MKHNLAPALFFCSIIMLATQAEPEPEVATADSTPPDGWLAIDKESICQPLPGSRHSITLKCNDVEITPSIEFDGEQFQLSFKRRHLQYASNLTSTVNIKNIEADVSLRHFSMIEIQQAAASLSL